MLVWYGLDIRYEVDRQKITSFDRWVRKVMEMAKEKKKNVESICRKVFQKKNPDSERSIRLIQWAVAELMQQEEEKKGR